MYFPSLPESRSQGDCGRPAKPPHRLFTDGARNNNNNNNNNNNAARIPPAGRKIAPSSWVSSPTAVHRGGVAVSSASSAAASSAAAAPPPFGFYRTLPPAPPPLPLLPQQPFASTATCSLRQDGGLASSTANLSSGQTAAAVKSTRQPGSPPSLRACHRLRSPEDAFQLSGPLRDSAMTPLPFQSQPPQPPQQLHRAGTKMDLYEKNKEMIAPSPMQSSRFRAIQPGERRRLLLSATNPSLFKGQPEQEEKEVAGSTRGLGPAARGEGAQTANTVALTEKDKKKKKKKRAERHALSEEAAAAKAEQKQARAEKRQLHEEKKAARLAVLEKDPEHWESVLQEYLAQVDEAANDGGREGTAEVGREGEQQRRDEGSPALVGSHRQDRLLAAYKLHKRVQQARATGGSDAAGNPSGVDDNASHCSVSTLSESLASDLRHGEAAGDSGSDGDDDLQDTTTITTTTTDSTEDTEAETDEERKLRVEKALVTHFTDLYARRTEAAGVLQRAWRCSRARLVLHNRRQLLYHYVYQQQKAAALCIVGALKAQLQQRRRRLAMERRQQQRDARAEAERAMVHAVDVVETAVKAWLAQRTERQRLQTLLGLSKDERLKRYAAAAVVVQRWWRLVPARRAYWQRRRVEVAAQRLREAEAQRREAAATTIQKVVRGVLGRRAFYAFRITRREELAERQRRLQQCTDVLLLTLREYTARRRRLALQAEAAAEGMATAAATIQRGWKQSLVHRRLQAAAANARLLHTSAITIQHAWQHYTASRELRYLRRLQETVQLDRLAREKRTYSAVLCLQRFARNVVLARRRERIGKADYGRAALSALFRLQSVGRGYIARQQMGCFFHESVRQEAARIARETVLRAKSTALAEAILVDVRSLYLAYTDAMAHESEIAELRQCARQALTADASATTLQRATRRWLQRRRAAERRAALENATVYIQAAAVCLQGWWRGVLARRQVEERERMRATATRKRLEWEDVLIALAADQQHEPSRTAHSSVHGARQKGSARSLEEGKAGAPRPASQARESSLPKANTAEEEDAWMCLYDDEDSEEGNE